MKNTLLILFLTVTFAFSSYARQSSYINKVLSVVTNGTEVITITETTHKEDIGAGSAGLSGIKIETVTTTNVTVSTIPTPLTDTPKKDWRTSQKEAYRNAYEFLSKPIPKKEEK